MSSLRGIFIGVVLMIAASGCSSTGSDDGSQVFDKAELDGIVGKSVSVAIPDFPFTGNDAIEVDKTLIESFAVDYIAENPGEVSDAEFFLGYLPLKSADMLCSSSPDVPDAKKLMGNLYVSGYFGGVWLRDNMGPHSASHSSDSLAKMNYLVATENLSSEADPEDPGLVFNVLTKAIEMKMKRARGSDAAAIISARLSITPFLMIYGYNWGYFDYVMKNPPEGAEGIVPDCECKRMLDCRVPSVKLETLDKYKPYRDVLENPKMADGLAALRWYEMKLLTGLWAEGAVRTGSGVWENIMNENMDVQAYRLLLDLSARFMLVAEMNLIPAMKGFAEGNADDCRCGLKQQAAMIAWAGSYFMGLSSDAPAGTFPKMEW
jgi:hypothetical protein